MKRVVISSNTAWTIFNHRAGLIKTLQDAGYEVHTVAPESNFTDIQNPGTVFHPVKNLERKGKNPFSDLFLIREYYKIYKAIQPQAVFGYTIKANIYSAIACRLARIPIVCTVNGLGTAFDNPKGFTYKIVKQLYKFAFRKAKAVVFQNTEDRVFFEEQGIIGSNLKGQIIGSVNGSGVDLLKFKSAPVPAQPVFMLISRMLKNKGVPEFIEASRRIKRTHPDAEFILLGPADNDNPMGVPLSELEALDRAAGAYYAGAAKDVRPYLEKCSCMVLPTYYKEGVPKILIEALAMGRPIITTDTPGCRETVIPGGNGWFVEARSADSLCSAMEAFLALSRDEQGAMGVRSRKLAEEKFDENKVIATYMEILQHIYD
ncbi:MAG: glycosyltransferase family 4 protein [Spirochaetia bacterium]|nr:glycosyltransferase family 4 protein [Spirochaetia bacterium]